MAKKEVLIFCQAPADIQYALKLYDMHVKTRNISIVVVNVNGIFEFLNSLQLNLASLKFIEKGSPEVSKNPLSALSERTRLGKIYTKEFANIKQQIIIFFSHFHDPVTFYLVKRLSKDNVVLFIDHYDTVASRNFFSKKPSLKTIFYLFNIWISTGIYFVTKYYSGGRALEFDYLKHQVRRIPPPVITDDLLDRYSYKTATEKPAVLFLETKPKKEIVDYQNYKSILSGILSICKDKGLKIYFKAHPRAGASDFIEPFVDGVIPSHIPSEFVNPSSFTIVMGITSSGMVLPAVKSDLKVVSLINMIPFTSDYIYRVQSRLSEASNNRIIFVHDNKDFIQLLTVLRLSRPEIASHI